jgi:hypothetical protein
VTAAPIATPHFGVYIPAGDASDLWNTGYSAGINFPIPRSMHGDWRVSASFQRITPDAEARLAQGGHEYKVQSSEGDSKLFELALIGRRNLIELGRKNLKLGLEYGAGITLVSDSKIRIQGSYETNTTALTRVIYREPETVAAPKLSLGISFSQISFLEAGVSYNMLFTDSGGRHFVLAGINFLPIPGK